MQKIKTIFFLFPFIQIAQRAETKKPGGAYNVAQRGG